MRRLQQDQLLANALHLMVASGLTAALGFVFWIVAAHLFTPSDVGAASSLIAGTQVLSLISLLGFNSSLIRFLPRSDTRNMEINSALVATALAATAAATVYVIAIPQVAPDLELIRASPMRAVAFVLLSACAAVNLLTDSIFVAYRAARYNVLVDGVLQAGSKLCLPLVLTGLGAFGLYLASGLAAVIAVAASVALLVIRFGYRPRVEFDVASVRRMLGFTAASYTASIFNYLPILLVPVILIREAGAAEAAYYLIAFQIVSLLSAVAYSVSQSLLADSAHGEFSFTNLAARSAKILAVATVLPALVLAAGSKWLLLVFGAQYSERATVPLIVLAVAAPAVSGYVWSTTLLKVSNQLRTLVLVNVLYAVTILAGTIVGARHSLVAVALAWLAGNVAATVAAMAALWVQSRRLAKVARRVV